MQKQPTETRKKIPVKNHPGIYEWGDSFVVQWREGKKQGSKTLPDLKSAVVFQAGLTIKRAKGETLIPVKKTFDEISSEWLRNAEGRRDAGALARSTYRLYELHLRLHLTPTLGHLPIRAIDEERVADLVRALQRKGKAGGGIQGVLSVLGQIMDLAVRRQAIARNPVAHLHSTERPVDDQREMFILDEDEISLLLDASLRSPRTGRSS